MSNKRAVGTQTGGPAVTLIGAITLLFIFYILFLPPESREELLKGTNVSGTLGASTLLDESPGRLEFTEKGVFDHPLSNMYLSETKNAHVIAAENPFTVTHGWFSEQRKTMTFTITDIEHTDNVILSFQAPKRAGALVVLLNNQPIFQGQLNVQNPTPLVLPKQLLTPVNQVEFSVTGGTFSTQEYSLADIKIIAEIAEAEKQTAINTFTSSGPEIDHFDSAFLDFYAICEQETIGPLHIELNGKTIYSSTPACDSLNRQDLYKEDLLRGKNTLLFTSTKGTLRLEQLRERTILKPAKTFIDYFTITSDQYDDIIHGNTDIVLHIEFVDDKQNKQSQLNVNGKYTIIDQDDPTFEKEITTQVHEGNNYIELKPLTELNIVRLKVTAE